MNKELQSALCTQNVPVLSFPSPVVPCTLFTASILQRNTVLAAMFPLQDTLLVSKHVAFKKK